MTRAFDDTHTTDPALLRAEAAAEAAQKRLVAEAQAQLDPRCPECGALGSMEEFDGVWRCGDCDEGALATKRVGGYGRK
jgi:ribosomal protein L37AE/L43A